MTTEAGRHLGLTIISGSSSAAALALCQAPSATVRRNRIQREAAEIPGALLNVRQGDRSYTVAAGYADKAHKVPMRAGDTYEIGSTTKKRLVAGLRAQALHRADQANLTARQANCRPRPPSAPGMCPGGWASATSRVRYRT